MWQIGRLQDDVNPTSSFRRRDYVLFGRKKDVVTFLRRPEDVLKTSVSAGSRQERFSLLQIL